MSWKVWCSLMVAAAVVTTTSAGAVRATRQAQQCSASEDCILFTSCRPLQDAYSRREPGYEQLLRNSICGGSLAGRDLRVCCPESGSLTITGPIISTNGPLVNGEDLLPKDNKCGQPGPGVRVVFGEDAGLYAYPWMALLGYKDKANPTWSCGGALINDRYVLTAAHCVHRNFTVPVGNGDVVTVRIGEHNTATNPDCPKTNGPLPCAPAPQDFSPEEVIVHSTFNERVPVSDDIALIRLDRKVTLGKSVQPVCLPQMGLNVEEFLGTRDAVVAGWGSTEVAASSNILQAAKIPFANKTICEPHYPGQLVKEQVCLGGRDNVDSCFGDSGGPVFQTKDSIPPYTVLGIVSRGLRVCGTPGAPAVYTNVAFYRKWIADTIKP